MDIDHNWENVYAHIFLKINKNKNRVTWIFIPEGGTI